MTTFSLLGSPINVGFFPLGIAVSPDGAFVYVASLDDSNLSIIDSQTLIVSPVPVGGFGFDALAVTPDGAFIYLANNGDVGDVNNIVKVDAASQTIALSLTEPGLQTVRFGVAASPDGNFVYITNNATNELVKVSVSGDAILGTLSGLGSSPFGIAITPNPAAPLDLKGSQKKNDFRVIYELYNRLTWEPSPSSIAGYNIYRNGVKIAVLPPTATSFEDHDRKKGEKTIYFVRSFFLSGTESNGAEVVIE
jgi:DNA-binding beta-propeller fold protein YncE